ncbi:MAG: riboflavin synthase [Thermodesulfobacteriota bacterium]
MFTGIIQDKGRVALVERQSKGLTLKISTNLDLSSLKIGDSIAVDGVCLTVVELAGQSFLVEVSPETRQRTTLAKIKEGQEVNLELPLKMSDLLGGHFVAGHVDGTGEIVALIPEGNSQRYFFRTSPEITKYLIPKGSVAVDGISLTIVDCQREEFSVVVIPHTAAKTTLGKKKVGDQVNLEVDLLAKYIEKFMRHQEVIKPRQSKIDEAYLAEHGFIK